jgi:two-component system, NtrC family, sensor kinase
MGAVFPFLIAFFLVPFVQKVLQTAIKLPNWHRRLDIGKYAAFTLLAIELAVDGDYIAPPVFFFLLVLVSIPAYLLRDDLSNARLLLWVIVPFGIVYLMDNQLVFWTPKFYEQYSSMFGSFKFIAMLSSVVLLFIARNQQKRYDKALELQEENRRILEAKKLDLEHQVAERTAELVKQKEELEKALENLKATQNQLIQSEKLASLGELTAGIAHEIQNPLNFVNNFAELSVELANELQEALRHKGIEATSEEGELVADLIQNQEKINLHGKRASSIVKGMLEHSRASTGVKELTDINKLADEYLRLSYHGLRAKDKSFNANFELIADPNLPQINIIPQDMGRVLLNLINNAFQSPPPSNGCRPEGGVNYQKKVTVRTFFEANNGSPFGGQGGFLVSDNGSGIPADVLPKIFQPFFTTKPTGQGTGLGLSLAYDIVTKGHGGTIEVESVEGEGTTFTVKLPLNK